MARREDGETGNGTANGTMDDAAQNMTPDLERLEEWLRLGKAAVFSDCPGAEIGPDREKIRNILLAAKKGGGSGARVRRFPRFAVWPSIAAAVAMVIWIGMIQTGSRSPGTTMANFIQDESDILPAMRGGESGTVLRWLAAARAGVAADAPVADVSGIGGRPSAEFLRKVKTSLLLTLEEAEHDGVQCLALRLYAVETGMLLGEKLIFPLEEDDVEAAIMKAAGELECTK